MNSNMLRRAAAVATILLTAACADAPTAPKAASTPATGLNFSLLGTITGYQADTAVTKFTVDPTTSTFFQVGSAHGIYFPAFSICDPSVTSYGPTEWDKPCTAMTRPIVITAKSWTDRNGLPKIDFSPALRFTYQTPGDYVSLGMAVGTQSTADAMSRFKILYCSTPLLCIDESIVDASMRTQVSPQYNAVYRRIKHFSVYNVSSGFAEEGVLGLSLSRASGAVDNAPVPASRTGHLMSSGRAGQEQQ
jgi:hypothetical protein